MACASVTRSRAETNVRPSSGQPFGVPKCELTMPMARALAFISAVQFSTDPAAPSARTLAPSLAETVAIPRSTWYTLTRAFNSEERRDGNEGGGTWTYRGGP